MRNLSNISVLLNNVIDQIDKLGCEVDQLKTEVDRISNPPKKTDSHWEKPIKLVYRGQTKVFPTIVSTASYLGISEASIRAGLRKGDSYIPRKRPNAILSYMHKDTYSLP